MEDFRHCERDFKWKIKCAKEKEPFIPKVKVYNCTEKLEKSITKTELLKHLTQQCEEAVKVNTMTLSILYSGHGRELDGAWKTTSERTGGIAFDEDESNEHFIQIHEVVQAIKDSGYKSYLEITSDSCYSGKLCMMAHYLWEQDER